ncbi:MAG: alginate lyase family protein [Woeseiaceae bacterium]|nr:alginate lyase family protein [Woeseiaceae bacterium]
MQSLQWYMHRLRSMGPREIAWRLRSAVAAQLDLVRIPLGVVPAVKVSGPLSRDEFLPGFSCSDTVPVAGDAPDRPAAWDERLVTAAERTLDDRLSYFDLEDQFLGAPIEWQRDWSSGKAAELRLSHLTDYRDFADAGDCKLVWEPNRHHQLVVLARAWRITGKRRYARKVVDLALDWIEQNPFGYGMNWKSGLELGVRLINWVWAIDLIRDAEVCSNDEWSKLLRCVYLLIWDTRRRYSQGSSANNHLVGEVAGVYVACRYFRDFPRADAWSAEAADILERELFLQSFADGCTREHAFGYQFFVLQFYSLCLVAGSRSGAPLSPEFGARLHAMYRFMADVCRDTGSQPEFGDADDGYVLDLGDHPRAEAAPLIAVGAALFDDATLAAPSETAWWLFGEEAGAGSSPEPARTSGAYRESGYFVLRSTAADVPTRVFFDCAELGFGSIAAHGHADCLSFSMAVNGREILVDPGTYDYYTYPKWRDYFRSTRAHNTVSIDGEDQSEMLGSFLWGRRANATLLDWQDGERSVTVTAEHDGYTFLDDPVVHRRSLTLDKETGGVDILDTLACAGRHEALVCFHVAPGCDVTDDGGEVLITRGGERVRIAAADGKFEVVRASEEGMSGWVGESYHRKSPGVSVFLVVHVDGNTEIRTRIKVEAAQGAAPG